MPSPYDWSGYPLGARAAFCAAGAVNSASFVGFGALLNSVGYGLFDGLLTVPFMWALPGQVVYIDGVMKGLSVFAIFAAVTATAVRLLPMTVLVLPKARMPGGARWLDFLLAHFTALTMWIMATALIDGIERPKRLPWLIGLGSTLMALNAISTVVGYELASRLPVPVAMAMVFLTPAFFGLSLIAGAKHKADYLAILFGAVLGPLAYRVAPQFDLVIAGLIGGTAAFVIGQRR